MTTSSKKPLLSNLQRKFPGLYKRILETEELNILLDNFIKKKKNWTKENLQTEALKYNSRSEFSKKSGGAYQTANNLGILNEICSHMINTVKYPKNYWSLDKIEELKEISNKYTSRTEWMSNDISSYRYAFKNDLMNSLMPIKKHSFTFEECKTDALTYKTKGEWKLKSNTICNFACTKGWYNECTIHMNKINKELSYEQCEQEANKYKLKSEWKKNSYLTYAYAIKHKWFTELCKHMTVIKAQSKSQIIYQYDININLIKMWEYANEISRVLNIINVGSAALHNSNKPKEYKIRGGFIFSYKKLK